MSYHCRVFEVTFVQTLSQVFESCPQKLHLMLFARQVALSVVRFFRVCDHATPTQLKICMVMGC